MATSSIFHNVKLDTPEKAEAFVAALEASICDSSNRPSKPMHTVNTDSALSKRLHALREKAREADK